jgi:hypothetical protein
MSAFTGANYCVLTLPPISTATMRPFISYQYCGRHSRVDDALILQFGGSIRSAKTVVSAIRLPF